MGIHWFTLLIGILLGATVLNGIVGGLFSKAKSATGQ
jgi:hypothetical protein